MSQVMSVTFTFGGDDEEMNKKRYGYKWHLSYHKAIGLLDSFKAKVTVLSPPHTKVFVRRWGFQWESRWCIEWHTSCWWSDGSYDGMGSVLSENIGGIPSQEPSWDGECNKVSSHISGLICHNNLWLLMKLLDNIRPFSFGMPCYQQILRSR